MGKLVRDRVVEIISRKGEIPHWHKIRDDGEFLEKLLNKLFEETHEVIGSKTPNERLLECVDVAEVLFAIIRLQKVTLRQFQKKNISRECRDTNCEAGQRRISRVASWPCITTPSRYSAADFLFRQESHFGVW
jgi:predicted house-cleaning noncanonical NTP pyrophosphatase (MazG superfamily)